MDEKVNYWRTGGEGEKKKKIRREIKKKEKEIRKRRKEDKLWGGERM